ncbi:hypothetical protein DKK76_05495 [Frischella perrara]|uniref:Uncharacterized protein n=1 Tax=Frischella perrara TaxID=1267021 RepID=A0A318MR13_FRIPE|nr:hypothetical protein [Frischella perrara]PXY95235.1 hypothetical protein DKK76_05495 [Frischella perrara]
MNILNKLVRGELSLAVTFWIFYILVRLIVNCIFGICYTLFFANRIPATPFLEILLVTSIIDFIIIIMVIIGIFNILRKKVTSWGIIALIICLINFITIFIVPVAD